MPPQAKTPESVDVELGDFDPTGAKGKRGIQGARDPTPEVARREPTPQAAREPTPQAAREPTP